MSSKMIAAEPAWSFDTVEDAATDSMLTNESMICDPGSGAKEPGSTAVLPKLDVSSSANGSVDAPPSTKKGDMPNIFPAEIWTAIIKLAMTSDSDGRFLFGCGAVENFKPNVAVSLLRVNHATYHEAIAFLYSENIFFFHYLGTDLKIIDKPVGLSNCVVSSCPSGMAEPRLKKMEIQLGSYFDIQTGTVAVMAFKNTLKALRRTIHVEDLLLHTLPFTFIAEECVKDFAEALTRIKVSQTLTITGPAAQYYHCDPFTLAKALGMDLKPVEHHILYPFGAGSQEGPYLEQGHSYFRFQLAEIK